MDKRESWSSGYERRPETQVVGSNHSTIFLLDGHFSH